MDQLFSATASMLIFMYDSYITFRFSNPLPLHVYLYYKGFDEGDYFFVSGEKIISTCGSKLKQF
jgi:hypothetical protein